MTNTSKSLRDARYYEGHKTLIKARVRAYKLTNPEKSKAWDKAAYQKRKPQEPARFRNRRQEHHAMVLAEDSAYRATHRESIAANNRKYRASANCKNVVALWRSRNRVRLTLQKLRRRTLELELPDTLTTIEWLAIVTTFGGRCAYCGIIPKSLTIDHMLPLSRGGPTVKENIVPACKSCNSKKHNHLPEEAGMRIIRVDS